MTGSERGAAALIALVAWVGLVVQFAVLFGSRGSAVAALWVMLRFFTILTNLLVAVLFTGIAAGRPAFAAPWAVAGTTLAILLVGIIYVLLLRGLHPLAGARRSPTRCCTK